MVPWCSCILQQGAVLGCSSKFRWSSLEGCFRQIPQLQTVNFLDFPNDLGKRDCLDNLHKFKHVGIELSLNISSFSRLSLVSQMCLFSVDNKCPRLFSDNSLWCVYTHYTWLSSQGIEIILVWVTLGDDSQPKKNKKNYTIYTDYLFYIYFLFVFKTITRRIFCMSVLLMEESMITVQWRFAGKF